MMISLHSPVVAAFGVPVIRHAGERAIRHYQDTDIDFNEARQKMADIPDTATLIDNPSVLHLDLNSQMSMMQACLLFCRRCLQLFHIP